MQAINGRLYPPLQYVSFVDKGAPAALLHITSTISAGAAYDGGLRQFDRLLDINGNDVQGAKHAQARPVHATVPPDGR